MKFPTRILMLSIPLLLVGNMPVTAESFDKEAAIQDAKRITQSFAGSLQKELKAAMQEGGPINALGVCNVEAMPITAKASDGNDALVSRVSLKNRNPENVPNEWQAAILKTFDKRAAEGESPDTIASATFTELENGKQQLRFMKAMPTGGVCLACHGQQIAPDLQAKLDELYPEDSAIGYSAGEIRGAIVVVKEY